jgi:hypothetical protein
MIRSRPLFVAAAVSLALFAAVLIAPLGHGAVDTLPNRLSDRAFWRMIEDFSEPGGVFRSDNFVSNEMTFQEVIPQLKLRTSPRGAYLGVGPDQNFTYIAALGPRMAFIVDIRRQNMIQHLMYKALIEMSADRAEFLSRLFSRPRPAGLKASSTPAALFQAFDGSPATEALFRKNLQELQDRLVKRHGFGLSDDDLKTLDYVYHAFYAEGPTLRYTFPRQRFGDPWFPTYAQLMQATDRNGVNQSYMASEERYRALREFERNNLLVPIVGDFAGDKAIRAVGRYLKEHGATVNFIYTSNVEQYLFQNDAWQRYYESVATLPLDERSTFLRAYFDRGFRYPPGIVTPDLHSVTLLDPVLSFLTAFRAGQVISYSDVIGRSQEGQERKP